jgi:hypothetical protein
MNRFTPLTTYLRRRLQNTSFDDVDRFRALLLLERLTLQPLRSWYEEALYVGLREQFPDEANDLFFEIKFGKFLPPTGPKRRREDRGTGCYAYGVNDYPRTEIISGASAPSGLWRVANHSAGPAPASIRARRMDARRFILSTLHAWTPMRRPMIRALHCVGTLVRFGFVPVLRGQ